MEITVIHIGMPTSPFLRWHSGSVSLRLRFIARRRRYFEPVTFYSWLRTTFCVIFLQLKVNKSISHHPVRLNSTS